MIVWKGWHSDGLWFVISDRFPNLFIAHRDLWKIFEDLPNIVQHCLERE